MTANTDKQTPPGDEMVTIGELPLKAVAFVASQEGILPQEFTSACRAHMAARKSPYDKWKEYLGPLGSLCDKGPSQWWVSNPTQVQLFKAAPELLGSLIDEWNDDRAAGRVPSESTELAIRSAVPTEVANYLLKEDK